MITLTTPLSTGTHSSGIPVWLAPAWRVQAV